MERITEVAKILIIEDENDINQLINEAFTKEHYECTSAYSGTEGLMRAENEEYDLILLDLMLPGMCGEKVLEELRKINDTPVIILSAKDELDTKVDMLTLGAEDYITKPFELKELLVRALVQLRKHKRIEDVTVLEHKGLRLCIDKHEVSISGSEITLTLQEFKILELLLRHPDKVFSKQEIYQYAWDEYYIGEDKTINVHISNIRQKIKKITSDEYIDTIWGIGFRLAR